MIRACPDEVPELVVDVPEDEACGPCGRLSLWLWDAGDEERPPQKLGDFVPERRDGRRVIVVRGVYLADQVRAELLGH